MGFQSFETMVRYGRLLQVHMLSVESMRSKISPAFVLRGVDLLPTGAFRRDGGGGGAGRWEALTQLRFHRKNNAKA